MAKFKIKRKNFNVAAAANVAKGMGLGKKLAIGGGLLGAGAGYAVNRLGGGDLISGGEKSAKEMEFS